MAQISGATRIVGVVADPVAHVQTPQALNVLFAAQGYDCVVVPMHVPAEGLKSFVEGLRGLRNLDGLVITVPHKVAARELADTVAGDAVLAGAVNVLRRTEGGRFEGALFDGRGFVSGLIGQGIDPKGRSALLLGAGGAASAIAVALVEAGVSHLAVANRSRHKAEALVDRIAAAHPAVRLSVSDANARGHDLVVNGTSLGLKAGDPLPLDPDTLAPEMTVAEVIMHPEWTPLLLAARDKGCRVHMGRRMLDAQLTLIAEFVTGRTA